MAWARAATPACCMICSLVRLEVSLAKSVSRIWLSAADSASVKTDALFSVLSRRFWAAPSTDRPVFTESRAVSRIDSAAAAPVEVEAALDADDQNMLRDLDEQWATSARSEVRVVVFDEVDATDQANQMSEDALREALAHASLKAFFIPIFC